MSAAPRNEWRCGPFSLRGRRFASGAGRSPGAASAKSSRHRASIEVERLFLRPLAVFAASRFLAEPAGDESPIGQDAGRVEPDEEVTVARDQGDPEKSKPDP